ncbi:hypothetical protein HW452_11640 [Halomonas aquamarina]|uniref:Uncharacterized protein n=1 Tax=Vreelandella aquamarina TaxID=77097 RepID=A0ACC5VWC9_9GAMM|nr:HEPN domain-containing protein [Halomonas aquamarina]MBZ5488175.1 hypothetical protein [Halomonas aquamarina]
MEDKVDELFGRYQSLYDNLFEIIELSEDRVLSENPDNLFSDNVNFFVKSYMINICSYLEAYLQDLAYEYAKEINRRIRIARIPHNFICWKASRDPKDKDLAFENADYPSSKRDISDGLSANPYKTLKAYRLLGIDLSKEDGFNKNKDLINTVVNKRNNIIHHNDNAIDVSFSDLSSNIKVFKLYMGAIRNAVLFASGNT